MVEWSRAGRAADFQRLQEEEWDLLIVGGGITGCGIALDAASRGFRTALVEQADFASGTSSRSSKLVHGGLRYLKQGQLATTLESSREKALLRRLAPHLVWDLPFLFPLSGGWKQRFTVGVGLWIYDLMAGFPRGLTHRYLDSSAMREAMPGLASKFDRGAYLYYDAGTDDARLVIHVAKRAVLEGALLINHAQLESFESNQGQVCGGQVRDRFGAQTGVGAGPSPVTVRAKLVINATGVWCDETRRRNTRAATPLVQASQGSHILVSRQRLPLSSAATLGKPGSNRLVFLIPWKGETLIGTTDQYYEGQLENPRASEQEIQQLLDRVNETLPEVKLVAEDIQGTYSGLRPLARSKHQDPSRVSRGERIHEDASGMISILGGKLTTYRCMAKRVVDLAAKRLQRTGIPSRTAELSLFPGEAPGPIPALESPLEAAFGSEAEQVRNLAGEDPSLAPSLYSLRFERAATLADLLLRRSRLGVLNWEKTQELAPNLATALAAETGWDPEEEMARLEKERP